MSNIGRTSEVKVLSPTTASGPTNPPSIYEMLPYIGAACGLFIIALAIFGIVKLIQWYRKK